MLTAGKHSWSLENTSGLSIGSAKETQSGAVSRQSACPNAQGPGFNSPHRISHMVEHTCSPSTERRQEYPLQHLSESEVNWTTRDLRPCGKRVEGKAWKGEGGRKSEARGEREEKEKKEGEVGGVGPNHTHLGKRNRFCKGVVGEPRCLGT